MFLNPQITRDRWISHWLHPETGLPYKLKAAEETAPKKRKGAEAKGGKSKKGRAEAEVERDEDEDEDEDKASEGADVKVEAASEVAPTDAVVVEGISDLDELLEVLMGSGYPSGGPPLCHTWTCTAAREG